MDTHGYIKHTPTQDKFLACSNPHYQRYIALTQGYVPSMHNDFSYVEIGCGNAFSLCINAAANPNAKFIGIDADPQFIEEGNNSIKNLGLKNVQLINASINGIDDLTEHEDVLTSDFVFVHNLMSCVPSEIRLDLFGVIGWMLKPGGIAFVSYDSLPGSTHRQVIHHIAQSYRDAIENDVERVETALHFINFMYQNKSHFTLNNGTLLEDLVTGINDPASAAHHYGNENYDPLWFASVSKEMNEQGLVFCGSTIAEYNDANLVVPREAIEELSPFPDIESLEFVKDMFGNIEERQDLYIRPQQTEDVVGQYLARMRFTLVAPRDLVVSGNNARIGYVEFPEEMTGPQFDKLAKGDALTNLDADIFHTLVGISKAIVPELRNDMGINKIIHREFIDSQLESPTGSFVSVVCSRIGSGFLVPKESMLLYLCGSHGAAQKWVEQHPDSSIDKESLSIAVNTRKEYDEFIDRMAPDLRG